jgi:hypothetical protein
LGPDVANRSAPLKSAGFVILQWRQMADRRRLGAVPGALRPIMRARNKMRRLIDGSDAAMVRALARPAADGA